MHRVQKIKNKKKLKEIFKLEKKSFGGIIVQRVKILCLGYKLKKFHKHITGTTKVKCSVTYFDHLIKYAHHLNQHGIRPSTLLFNFSSFSLVNILEGWMSF